MSQFLDLAGLTTLVDGIKNGDLVPGKVLASTIEGTISIDNLPQGALERLVVVANDTARFALKNTNVQVGDTVKVSDTGKMYYVKDESKLSSAEGYEEYSVGSAASVPWSGVTGKPSFATVAVSGKFEDLAGIPTVATQQKVGFMSTADKAKLDGIASGANKYTLPTASAEAIGGIKVAGTETATSKVYTIKLGSDGLTGVVKVPWTDTTYSAATTSAAGLMSATDKSKLDDISAISEAEIKALF